MKRYERLSGAGDPSSRLITCDWVETSSEPRARPDHELGIECERASDRDALALAAGELVRVAPQQIAVEADLLEQPATRSSRPRVEPEMHLERLADRRRRPSARVERRVRVLEHDLHVAPEPRAARRARARTIPPIEQRPSPRWARSAAAPDAPRSTCPSRSRRRARGLAGGRCRSRCRRPLRTDHPLEEAAAHRKRFRARDGEPVCRLRSSLRPRFVRGCRAQRCRQRQLVSVRNSAPRTRTDPS